MSRAPSGACCAAPSVHTASCCANDSSSPARRARTAVISCPVGIRDAGVTAVVSFGEDAHRPIDPRGRGQVRPDRPPHRCSRGQWVVEPSDPCQGAACSAASSRKAARYSSSRETGTTSERVASRPARRDWDGRRVRDHPKYLSGRTVRCRAAVGEQASGGHHQPAVLHGARKVLHLAGEGRCRLADVVHRRQPHGQQPCVLLPVRQGFGHQLPYLTGQPVVPQQAGDRAAVRHMPPQRQPSTAPDAVALVGLRPYLSGRERQGFAQVGRRRGCGGHAEDQILGWGKMSGC